MEKLHFDTLLVHAGARQDSKYGSTTAPIYQTTSYQFENSEQACKLFNLEIPGHLYTRLSNPTVAAFEERIAALEDGVAAVAASSGMAAQILIFQCLANQGDNFVVSPSLYGGTYNQFTVTLPRLGIEGRFVKSDHIEDWESRIDDHTKGIYVETIGNSDFLIPDFDQLSALCKKYRLPLIVDNTFAGAGYLCRPKEFGANIITHAATKWIGGHGNSIAGIVVDCGNFDWTSGRFPSFTEPSPAYKGLSFAEVFGSSAFAARLRAEGMRDYGSCLSPFNAFLLLQGVETLALRMDRICSSTLELAEWLQTLPEVESVNYPGLKDNPNHAHAEKYLHNGYGGVLTFCIKGGYQETCRFVDALKLVTFLVNVGDNKTLITHPASTTHSQLDEKALASAGIKPNALRLSVGIEHVEDIKKDILQALEKIKQ